MDLAIKKAKDVGVGVVTTHCKLNTSMNVNTRKSFIKFWFPASNHYGIASLYVVHAAEQGVIGFSFTNTSPLMVPTRAKNVSHSIYSG